MGFHGLDLRRGVLEHVADVAAGGLFLGGQLPRIPCCEVTCCEVSWGEVPWCVVLCCAVRCRAVQCCGVK